MYKVRNKVYAEAGSLLIGKNKRGYVFLGELKEFSEKAIRLDDMRIEGQFLVYSDGLIRESYNPNMAYEQLKAKYVKGCSATMTRLPLCSTRTGLPKILSYSKKCKNTATGVVCWRRR